MTIGYTAEKMLLERLAGVKVFDKTEKEKIADFDKRKLEQYKKWTEQAEIYLLVRLENHENIKRL